MTSTFWIMLLAVLGLGFALNMPSMNDDNETSVEDVNMHVDMAMMSSLTGDENSTLHAEMSGMDENNTWTLVGEAVEATMEEADKDELEDVSDPPVMSEDMCPEVLNLLHSMPGGLMKSLEELKQDHPVGNEPCFRAREYFDADFRQGGRRPIDTDFGEGRRRPLCSGPFYVVYGQYRYCCTDASRHHPLVERFGGRIRCRC